MHKPKPQRPGLDWKALAIIPRARRPHPKLQTWLLDPSSLTARLMVASNGDLQVIIVRQFIGRPSLSECKALAMPSHQLALVREVILQGCGQPWVFARSLLPLSSLTGKLRHLRKQSTRPLGAFLFSQPHLARSPIALAALSTHDGYLPAQFHCGQRLWGRRSVFWLEQKPLLVSEVFLPAFCHYHQL